MFKPVFILFFLIFHTAVYSQRIDYNTIILPSSAVDVSNEERIVQLAWQNHPSTQAVRKRVDLADIGKQQAQFSWLDYLRLQGNANEFTFDPDNERNDFFPIYNFSLTFTLGAFVQTPLEVKASRKELEIAEEEVKEAMLSIRADALKRYRRYTLAKDILKLELEAKDDAETNFQLVESRFRRGEETIVNYNLASNQLKTTAKAHLTAQYEFDLAKIDLEELIGVPLEEVIID